MYPSNVTVRLTAVVLCLLLVSIFNNIPLQAQDALKIDDHVLLSEAVVTPTSDEFIEIANPTASDVDLTNYYLSDDADYALLPGASGAGPAPNIGSTDFIAQFPPATMIPANGVLVIAFDGAGFETTFGFKADFEILGTDAGTPDMLATDVGASAGLTNSGEHAVLFTWDGTSDLVQDVDMVKIGTPSASNDIGNKTGVSVDGPDAGTEVSTYLNDAATMPEQAGDPGFGFSTKRIALETGQETSSGGNGLTGDDETTEDITVTWDGEAANPFTAPSPGIAEFLLSPELIINEVDADTPGTDTMEFIELYDGGVGNTPLDGLVLVFFNGSDDQSYTPVFDLDGFSTDANGFFVLGNVAVPNVDLVFADNALQNGADAVALYEGDATDFPNDTPVTDANLLDAIVYDTNDSDDSDLIDVLTPGQPQINEGGMGDQTNHSNQRIPNGEGGQRNTSTYTQIPPTPGALNGAPTVSFTTASGSVDEDGGTFDLVVEILNPDGNEVMVDVAFLSGSSTADGTDIDNYTMLTVTFSTGAISGDTETVTVTITDDGDVEGSEDAVFMLENIQTSGTATIGAPDTFTLTINDDDTPLPELVINEIDYDQSGTDMAEFIELKNIGGTTVNLDPLAVELVNGSGTTVYQTIDLPDVDLDAGDYFVICANAATTINCDLDVAPNENLIQNGAPDAVALVQGSTIIDAVSYEGDTGAPYTEGSGSGLEDDSGIDFSGISRFPDGADTDMNNVDLSPRCITPGSENMMADTGCQEPIEIILVINEVDADTPGTDTMEFIELYDGGIGNTPLDGLVLVFFNGSDDQSYLPVFDLDGFSTDANGFFVLGNAAVPNVDLVFADNALQNGADAVALYEGDATDFPNDTPVTTMNLLDALVYDTNDGDDAGLLVLLNGGQPQVNEDGMGDKDAHSNQRIPNGEGGQRNTDTYTQTDPTPGEINRVVVVAEIFEIQGNGLASSFDGQFVTTEDNIVTAVGPEGFFIQTPDARDDGDPLTSNGIYVFTNTAPTVAVGDQVDVTGEVEEFFDFTEFTNNPMVTVDNSGNALPSLITFDATTPSSDPATPSCDGVGGEIDDMNFECFEGMRIEVVNGAVGSGNQGFGSDPLAEVFVVADATRPFREPGIAYPGMGGLPVWDGNPEVFELDPDRLGLPNLEIPGGSTYSATGVLGFEFGDYELWPTALSVTEDPLVEPVRAKESNEMTLGTLNLFRLFDDVDDPIDSDGRNDEVVSTAEYQRRLTKFSQFIREVMLSPDILAVQEAEKLEVLEDLAAEIQADDPTVIYSALLIEGNDVGTIDVGFLVRSTVQVDEVTQLGKDETLTFDGSLLHDRPPLLLEATYTGGSMPKMIAVMNVHNRSLNGIDDPSDGPRVRQKRLEQAQSIAQKVQDFQTANPGVGLAVTGDFNAYEFTDGYVDAVGQIAGDFDPTDNLLSGPDLVDPNLAKLVTTLPAEERYSFVFDGSAQVLDHMLTTQLLTGDVRGLQYGRGNADAAEILIEDDTTPARSSDHDGLVLYVDTSGDPLLNEFVADHTGSDTDEFIELFGEPNTDYSTFSVLAVEGDAGGSLGEIDAVFPVGTTDASGFWTTGFFSNALENGTLTLLLVKGFTGSDGDDIDTNDDGVIDNMPWAILVDDVALTDEGAGDQTYSAVVLDPNFDLRNLDVGGASRIPNGLDTDSVSDWARNDFDGEGLPSFPGGGTPKNGEAINTPGTTNQLGTTPPAPEGLIINEVDADTPGSDTMEFIELYDGGAGNVALDNVVVVLFNGEDDTAYRAFDLDGFSTDADGFFVLGNADVPDVDLVFGTSTIQNGPDAVAIYAGEAADFPDGTGVTTSLLVDVLVYGPADEDDFGLRQLLNPNQPQVDEDGKNQSDIHSLQRIPNGSGGARNTETYLPTKPTPGAINGGADLSLDVSLGAVALNGNNITGTFLLTLMNDGPNNATGIVVKNALPQDVVFVSAAPSQGTFDPNTGLWTVGDVANGDAATLMLVLTIDQTINFVNFAEVTAANEADPDSDPADGTGDDADGAALTRDMPDISGFQADLSLTKTADVSAANVGDEVVFTLIINNAGPIPTAGVEVMDLLPGGLTYVSDSSDGAYDPTTGIWDVGAIAVGRSDTLRIVTTVNGTGSITNTASITASNLPDPDSYFDNDESGEDDQDSATVEVQTASEKATAVDDTAEIPATLELAPNYPNPFNPETTIPFGLPEATHVTLRVYDLLGRQVEVLIEGTLSAGRHVIRWNAASYPSGVYLVRIQAGGETRTQRLTLMK